MLVSKLAATLIIVALAGWRATESVKQDTCSLIRDTSCEGRKFLRCLADCPAGNKKIKELKFCEPCHAGTFNNNNTRNVDCLACPKGTFASKTGSTACSLCPAGKFTSKTGSTACSPCRSGTFSSSGAASCLKCPAGTYSSSSGSTRCTKCAPGTYSSRDGAAECEKCDFTFALRIHSGMTRCDLCPDNTHSLGPNKCSPVKRLGCFDDSMFRYLKDLPDRQQFNLNTPQLCIGFCRSKQYSYAGVQKSDLCFCGDSYGRYSKVPDSKCSSKCAGDSKQTCGDKIRNEIYSTGLNPVRRLGCFKDKAKRDLPHKLQRLNSNTPQLCIEHCKSNGYLYAGVQSSAWCMCGDDYGEHGKLPDSECSMKCVGDSKQTCGHHWKSEVYTTGLTTGSRLGCFKDKSIRDLPDMKRFHNNTPQLCVEHCKKKLYKYAGVQNTWCMCGNSFGRYGRLPDSECSSRCIGDSKQTCGNSMRSEVYSTGRNERGAKSSESMFMKLMGK